MRRCALCVLLFVLTGCAGSVLGRAPETQVCPPLAVPPEQAYHLSWLTLTQMGTRFTTAERPQRLSGVVRNAADFHVSLSAHASGTSVQATASIPPGKLTLGEFTLLDEFCTKLSARETAHAR